MNDRKKELLRLVELPDISAELETRNQLKSILTKELEAIRTENQNKTIQNDDLRSEYQQKSSEAAAEALRLSNLKNDLEQLDKKLNGPYTLWNTKALLEKEQQLKSELRQLVHQSQFLIQYMNRVQDQYNIENEPAKKSSPSGNNSSRYTTRTTRATSPTYT